MTDSHEITKAAPLTPTYIERPAPLHPLVELARKQTGELNVDQLDRLLALQERYEALQAKKEFDEAMAALKSEMPSVLSQDKKVDFSSQKGRTTYTHTSLGAAMDTVTPYLSRHGFSLTWGGPPNTEKTITVRCRISHRAGHFEEMELSGPPDTSGGKNPIQAIGSTAKYLQRYTALMLLGIATAEDIADADSAPITVDQNKNLQAVSYLQSIGISLAEAEGRVQRSVKDWTSEDLRDLREMAAERKSK